MQETPVKEVVRALLALPPERVAEAYDFILFLQERYGQVIDVSDEWTDEDIANLTMVSLSHASESDLTEEPDGSTG